MMSHGNVYIDKYIEYAVLTQSYQGILSVDSMHIVHNDIMIVRILHNFAPFFNS